MSLRDEQQSRAPNLADALAQAVRQLREMAGSASAAIVVVTPSEAICRAARQALAWQGPQVRVEFMTPEQLLERIAHQQLDNLGLAPEPAGWMGAALTTTISAMSAQEDIGELADRLRQPGWRLQIQSAVNLLERAEVSGAALHDLADEVPHAERCRVLGRLLEALSAARVRDRIYGLSDLARAALSALEADDEPTDVQFAGAIILGDRYLGPKLLEALQVWLAKRNTIRVAIPPLEAIPPAPHGMRLAALLEPQIEVRTASDTQLDRLKLGLFADTDSGNGTPGCGAPDGSVMLAWTPDEVREVTEAVRVVQVAIGQGLPLDKIAIVLPSPDVASVLSDTLKSARLPAVWLTAPPIAVHPATGFLLMLLHIADGEATVRSWYDLLCHPGFRLRNAVGALLLKGVARWRRILSRCGAGWGTGSILSALEDHHNLGAMTVTDPDGDQEGTAGLIRAIETVAATLGRLPRRATLAEHADAWSELVHIWWHRSEPQQAVLSVVERWRGQPIGPQLSLRQACELLTEALETTPFLRGDLREPGLRVIPPEAALGGDYEFVCLLGMSEGRFPRRHGKHPLLNDEDVRIINERTGAGLTREEYHLNQERRRLAGVLAASSGCIWISVARSRVLGGRREVLSSLMMDVLCTLHGPVTRSAVVSRRLLASYGRRSIPVPVSPGDAIGRVEYLVSRALQEPEAVMQEMVSHPFARRQLALHRSLDRFMGGGDAPGQPNKWTGIIPPNVLAAPAVKGTPLSAHELALLVEAPGVYLFRNLLQAWRPHFLPDYVDVLRPEQLKQQILTGIEQALEARQGTLDSRFETAWTELTKRALRFSPKAPKHVIEVAQSMATDYYRHWHKSHRPGLSEKAILQTGVVVDAEMPFKVRGVLGRIHGKTLIGVVANSPQGKRGHVEDELAYLFQSMALAQAGTPVEQVELISLGDPVLNLFPERDGERARLLAAHALHRLQVGWWPNVPAPFRLEREAETPLEAESDILTTLGLSSLVLGSSS